MDINLELKDVDNKFIARSKKTCLNKFRYTRQDKINELDDIAGFLIALERVDEAIDLLESVIQIADLDGEDGFWMTEHSRKILSFAYFLNKENGKSDLIKQVFIKYESNRMEKAKRTGNWPFSPLNEDLDYLYEEYEYWKEEYKNETHKYRCQVLVRVIGQALDLIAMWDYLKTLVEASEFDRIFNIVNELTPVLVQEINT